jgi:hypothetical protein
MDYLRGQPGFRPGEAWPPQDKLDEPALWENLMGTLEMKALLGNLRQFNEHWSRSMTSRE